MSWGEEYGRYQGGSPYGGRAHEGGPPFAHYTKRPEVRYPWDTSIVTAATVAAAGAFMADGSVALTGNVQFGLANRSIKDLNNATVLMFGAAGSAVNYFKMLNSPTGYPPGIYALGSDTDIDVYFAPKGAGVFQVGGSAPGITAENLIDANLDLALSGKGSGVVTANGSAVVRDADLLDVSAGAGDAGKPIKLDAGGHVDASMVNDADVDHGSIGGLTDDDHTGYVRKTGRSGGQEVYGGTDASDDLDLHSTSNATKGAVNIGNTGDVVVGDGSATEFRPHTDDTVDNGTADERWANFWAHLLHVKTSVAATDDPPSDTDLDGEFGEPATIGDGCVFLLDNDGDGTDGYLCCTLNGAWWTVALTKAV